MKASKVLFAIFCLTLAACAKHHDSSPAASNNSALAATATAETDVAQDNTDDDSIGDFQTSADDHIAIVNSINAGPLGIVRVDGEDAKNLFNSLAVQETEYPASDETQSNTARIGKNIECYQTVSRDSGEEKYDCNFYYDYKTGEAKTLNSDMEIARDISDEDHNYHGQDIVIMSPSGKIYITGENAKLVYDSLAVEPFKEDADADYEVKLGKSIFCNHSEKYSCLIEFNSFTGASYLYKTH